MQAAYTDAAGRPAGTGTNLNLVTGTLAGLNLAPGVYTWTSNVNITGGITLTGTATDVWIFQISGTLGIDSGKNIILAGGALPQNIFWQVAGAVTLGTGSHFEGNILAKTNIAMQTEATLNGRALAQTAVTLNANTILASTGHVVVTSDIIAPEITLNGPATVNLTVGQTYEDAGATATDNVDATVTVVPSGIVDTTTVGTYTITYNATDAAGNPATPKSRTINVVASIPTGTIFADGADTNNDGTVGVADYLTVKENYGKTNVACKTAGEGPYCNGADINKDGVVDREDLAILTANFGLVAVKSITVTGTDSAASVFSGATLQMLATILPADATNKTVAWSTGDESIATIDSVSGLLTAIKVGTITVTATATDGTGVSGSEQITVNPVAVTGVTLDKTSDTIRVGGTDQFTATITPSNATNKNVAWTSSDSNIVSVDATGEITAVSVGSATITVTTADGGYAATASITINAALTGGGGGGGGGYIAPTPTPTPTVTGKSGDANGDNVVDELDFSILMADWGKTGSSPADFNKDNVVDELDFSLLMANWKV
jgi:hypothetical protein